MLQAQIKGEITQAIERVKQTNPMAGSITNSVTINFVANAQLAVGGSAAMVYLPDEGEFLAQAGQATYINVGTLLPIYDETLPQTGAKLHDLGRNWVLDPVAVGIGTLRTKLLRQLKDYQPTIIRGNASEIIALAGLWDLDGGTQVSQVRGVDSTDSVSQAKQAAIALARSTNGAVAVSGETDFVTDGQVGITSFGGSHFMEKITGAGCALGGVMAVYATVTSPLIAALTGTAVFNLAGQKAQAKVQGPGSFQVEFLNELYLAGPQAIANQPFQMEVYE